MSKNSECSVNSEHQQRETSLVDPFGRHINYVRLSVTDRCNLRCTYCMAEEMTFLPKQQILSLEELRDSARAFVELGVRKIRLTGGEPLIRRDIVKLVASLSAMSGLDEVTMTKWTAAARARAATERRRFSAPKYQPRQPKSRAV